jgi:branched-chain amino acid transport system permease protein
VSNPYYIHLLILVGINSVLAMTFTLMLRTGLITTAIAAFWGIGAYASALLVRQGLLVWLALPVSAIITGIIGFVSGLLLVRKGGISFVIQTLVFGFIVVLLFASVDVFGARQGIFNIPTPEPIFLPFLGSIEFTSSKTPYYYLMLFLVFFVVLVFLSFYATWTGKAWRAIGLSPRLAESLGVDIFKYRLLAFVIAAAAAGLMGSFYAHYYSSIVPDAFDPMKALYTQVYAILGGINFYISGPIVGAAIMIIVPEILRVSKEIEPIFTSIILVLLVMFLPDGVLGLLRWLRRSPYRLQGESARIKNGCNT